MAKIIIEKQEVIDAALDAPVAPVQAVELPAPVARLEPTTGSRRQDAARAQAPIDDTEIPF